MVANDIALLGKLVVYVNGDFFEVVCTSCSSIGVGLFYFDSFYRFQATKDGLQGKGVESEAFLIVNRVYQVDD